jgi:hypothetical protein
MKSCEQEARDILERMGIDGAQEMTAGDLVELGNVIAENRRYVRKFGAMATDDHEPDGSDGIQFASREQAMVWAMERMREYAKEAGCSVDVFGTGNVLHGRVRNIDPIPVAARRILESSKDE